MPFSKSVQLLLTIASLALPARAGDWYVDAVSGNDANDGLTTGTAWKSLTHALAAIPSTPLVPHTIHAAPGVYDPANGEVYPLFMRPKIRLVGDQGSAATILEGAGPNLLSFNSQQSTNGWSFQSDSGADGLTLRNSNSGIHTTTDWGSVDASFHDLVISGMTIDGISVSSGTNFGGVQSHPTFDHVTVAGCNRGVLVEGFGGCSSCFSSSTVDLVDCVVQGNVTRGIYLYGGHGTAVVNLVRTRVTDNGGDGITGSNSSGGTSVAASASLIARNGGNGIGATGIGVSSSDFDLKDCTVADNGGIGLQVQTQSLHLESATLKNCIFFGNGNDIVAAGTLSASQCLSGDGDLNAQPNCFSADPLFVKPLIGDYRLRFGSPCIDVGNASSNGALDLLGHTRPYDGNLDTVAMPDIGAFEFEPLHRIGTPALGQQFGLEFWGATGSMSTLLLSKQPLTPAQSTPFGDFYLAPGMVITLATVPAKPGPAYILRRTVPNNPVLIGTTFSFQALTDSTAAPQGEAYTNPTSFVILP